MTGPNVNAIIEREYVSDKPFEHVEYPLSAKEKAYIINEIDANFYNRYFGKDESIHYSYKYNRAYRFEIRGYRHYNIYDVKSLDEMEKRAMDEILTLEEHDRIVNEKIAQFNTTDDRKEFVKILEQVKDCYPDFVLLTLYISIGDEKTKNKILELIENNPDVTTSEIVRILP